MTVYGIDFGTCYSCLAVAETGREPRVIPTAQGANTLPSVVEFRLNRNGTPRVGSIAKNAITPLSRNVAAFLKTEMDHEISTLSYEIRQGEFRQISPIEFAACVYKELYTQAQSQREANRQDTTNKVVITVPAVCSEIQREKTKVAAEQAGMEVIKIINEPTAAAISYNIAKGETIMVFDLGGGTHDVSIVQRLSGNNYQVIVTKGDPNLGGKYWDEKLVELTYSKLGLNFTEDVLTHARLIEFEKHKINLCTSDDVTFAFMDDEGIQHQVTLELDEFEEFTENLVERAISVARNAVEDAQNYHPNVVIKRICMSGGACRMQALKRALQRAFPRKTVSLNDPDKSIATGAAIYALSLTENGNANYDIHVTERGHAYGFKTFNSENCMPVIENFINLRNPLEITSRNIRKYMSTSSKRQRLTVYENSENRSVYPWTGEKPFFDGDILFDHIRAVGSPLDIMFTRDANGVVSIVVNADNHKYEFSFATTAGIISQEILENTKRLMELMEQINN